MKECPNCKKTYSGDDVFCLECGTPLVAVAEPPAEPTVVIPPIPVEAIPVSPPAPAPAPKKKSGGSVAAIVALVVCLVLAIGAAGFAGYEFFRYKDKFEAEQTKRVAAEDERTGLQEELDKLRLSHDNTASALEDANQQLEDVRGQLADVTSQLSSGSSQLSQVQGELDTLRSMLRGNYGFSSKNYFASKGVAILSKGAKETITIFVDHPGSVTYTFRTSSSGISCQWDGSFVNGQATITVTGVSEGYYTVSLTNNYNSEAFDILVIVTE